MLRKNDWFITFKPKHNAPIRLFCFHYGGGGASSFRLWVNDIIDSVEVITVQLPGREERYNEPLLNNIHSIINELCDNFYQYTNKPCIFFGHSLGALIAFEFARKLRKKKMIQPKHLIVSGTQAPQVLRKKPPIHKLSDERFIKELEKYKGIPAPMIENKELISMFLPAIRADFCVIETYEYQNEYPLPYPITALGGLSDDTFKIENLTEWKVQTNDLFEYHFFPGNHFFIRTAYKEVINAVNAILKKEIVIIQ